MKVLHLHVQKVIKSSCLQSITNAEMRKMGGYQARVRRGRWSAAEICFLLESSDQGPVEAWIVCLLYFSLSDLDKRHLSCMSWLKDISICLFKLGQTARIPVPFACPCKHDVEAYIFLFRLLSLQPALSLRLSRVHLDLCAALSIVHQVSLFSFSISITAE